MIHKATIEITVDTDKIPSEGWVRFNIKTDPNVPEEVQMLTIKDYPAALIAAKMMKELGRESTTSRQY